MLHGKTPVIDSNLIIVATPDEALMSVVEGAGKMEGGDCAQQPLLLVAAIFGYRHSRLHQTFELALQDQIQSIQLQSIDWTQKRNRSYRGTFEIDADVSVDELQKEALIMHAVL
ncbi:hypothetical protein [Stenotrophomonas maltophilia group sp. Smal12]|uniref:hypothetical protein n=1 Tax=Stenotrophomonas maltophilia group sp. Smal12 TaxID=3050414 RepID=UPI00300F412B